MLMAPFNAALSLTAPPVAALLAHTAHLVHSSSSRTAASTSCSTSSSVLWDSCSFPAVGPLTLRRRGQGQVASSASFSFGRTCSSNQGRGSRFCAAENGKGGENVESDVNIEELEARLGVRRRSQKRQGDSVATTSAKPTKTKEWDEMPLPEKAWSLYIGEKGLLFWINKLAYIFIFVIAGGWIVFRFIGPALGFYQLEGDILPPTQVFKGE